MKLSSIPNMQIATYTVVFTGITGILAACAMDTIHAQPSQTITSNGLLGKVTASSGTQLSQNAVDDEEYLGDEVPTKEAWINMLSPPKFVTRGTLVEFNKTFSFNVQFGKDSFDLTNQVRHQLESLRQALEDASLENQKFLIEGHTDSKGSPSHNQWLSEQRALSVKQFLAKDDDRVKAIGLGETHPLPHHNPEDPKNRRVKIRLVR